VAVEDEREPEAQHELEHARYGGVEQGIEQGQPRDAVADEELEVLDSDPLTGTADLGVGEAEPGAEPRG